MSNGKPATTDKPVTGDVSNVTTFTRKARKPVDPNETDAQKFKRLANNRTAGAIQNIKLVAQLANKANYTYTQEQADKVMAAIDKAVAEMKQAWAIGKSLDRAKMTVLD